MQKTTKILVAAGASCTFLATNLVAAPITTTLDLAPTGYRDSTSQGGEFTALLSGNTAEDNYILGNYSSNAKASVNGQTGIETFCVEMTQSFSPGGTYNTTIGTEIVDGSSSTPLSVGVAWLYMEFATGKLANVGVDSYTYAVGSGRETAADQLQDAIWYLQGEVSGTIKGTYSFNSSTDPFLKLVESQFGSLTDAEKSDIGNNYGVMVLNLTSTGQNGQTVYDQDQLVYCPVPEPATAAAGAMLLMPLGLSGLRALRNRKKNSNTI